MSRRSSLQYPSGGLLLYPPQVRLNPTIGSLNAPSSLNSLNPSSLNSTGSPFLPVEGVTRSRRLASQPSLYFGRNPAGIMATSGGLEAPFGTPSAVPPHLSHSLTVRQQRRSQPSLVYYFNQEMNPDSALRHSQPMLFTGAERVRVESKKSSPLARPSPQTSPGHPFGQHLNTYGGSSPRLYQPPNSSPRSLPPCYSISPGSPNSQRRFPRPSATEKRILKRAPQSDLAYRLQRQNMDSGAVLSYEMGNRPEGKCFTI